MSLHLLSFDLWILIDYPNDTSKLFLLLIDQIESHVDIR